MANPKIEPRTLKGFRDFLPTDMRLRSSVMQTIRKVFEKYGYDPLETPTLEYDDILSGKYGEDEKLMYRFKDHGDRAVAMKYDLTVPAARVIAQYYHQLPMPFKRYQMQPVWRADNTQRGRYRELWQCDADTFGSSSTMVEAEWMCMGIEVFSELGLSSVVGMLNNRKLLDVILKEIAQCNESEYLPLAISLDKYDKVGWAGVLEEMQNRGVRSTVATRVKELLDLQGTSQDKISSIEQVIKNHSNGVIALNKIKYVFDYIKQNQLDSNKVEFNPLIIRGLAYYTGLVWEWQLTEGGIGSLGGGGRYDQLIGQFIGNDIPSAGGSFGLERIIDVIKEKKMDFYKNQNILVCNIENDPYAIKIAALLRQSGYDTQLYPDDYKLEKQIKYAIQKNLSFVILAGPAEAAKQTVILKNLSTRSQQEVPISGLVSLVATEQQKV